MKLRKKLTNIYFFRFFKTNFDFLQAEALGWGAKSGLGNPGA